MNSFTQYATEFGGDAQKYINFMFTLRYVTQDKDDVDMLELSLELPRLLFADLARFRRCREIGARILTTPAA